MRAWLLFAIPLGLVLSFSGNDRGGPAKTADREGLPLLRSPTEGEGLVADYASLGLSLGRHPMALLRERFALTAVRTAGELRELPHGLQVHTVGLVITRQRPGSASGVIFVTLEDETGYANLIVWPKLAERQRKVLLGARLLGVVGTLQKEGDVLHVIATRFEDHSALLGSLLARSRDFH